MVPGVVLFVGLFFFPYSPRWLASKDRWDEALEVLARTIGKGDRNHPKVLAQYQEIEDALRFDREEAISSYKALVAKGMFKRVFLGMSVQAWSQLCGMNISPCPPVSHSLSAAALTSTSDVLHRLYYAGRWHRISGMFSFSLCQVSFAIDVY
jgi:hypothetical protein